MMVSETTLRLGVFFGVLLIVALAEYLWPKRTAHLPKTSRWSRNLSLVVLGSVAARLLIPFTAASVAVYAEQNHMGLFNVFPMPFALAVVLSIVLLDFLIYTQHVVFHRIPWLWRLHKVHHIDQDFDVTTGLRFHPVEILLSALIKCGAVWLLGAPFFAVVTFEILLNATAMFNHGNLHLPAKLDRILRRVVVTPDMHRVHHSVLPSETNSNYGFNLPWWDRLFKTYQAQPKHGHTEMTIGLNEYQDARKTGLLALLVIPFQKK